MNDVLFSSASAEWLTPAHIIKSIVSFFGGIALDPCAESHTDPNVPAAKRFTKEDDGLKQEWVGNSIYMNPPYGRGIGVWITKLLAERRHYSEAITLIPARVDTGWWDTLMQVEPIFCLLTGRLTFHSTHPGLPPSLEGLTLEEAAELQEKYRKALKGHLDPDTAPFPSALVYIGERRHLFAHHFAEFGRIYAQY